MYNEIMSWPKSISRAKELQEQLRHRVKITPLKKEILTVAGVDASFTDDSVIAVASLFSYPLLKRLEDAHAVVKTVFPYEPGYLSFREGEAIIEAVLRLETGPDLILADGQGIAHPRGLGIASHVGVLLGIPTVGCAKSRLVGEYQEPPAEKGGWSPLLYEGRMVGAVLRTRESVRPLFISPGHLTDVRSSIGLVMRCITSFRIPEPLRRADRLTRMLKGTDPGGYRRLLPRHMGRRYSSLRLIENPALSSLMTRATM